VGNTQAEHGPVAQHGFMTIWQLLNVSAAAVGLVIIVVMAAIPFLTDERGRATSQRFIGRRRPVLGPPPHPPRGTA
jgi:hypothetical protein